MSYKVKRSKEIVLVFVAVPVLLALVVIALIAVQQRLFEKKHVFFTSLKDAVGLSDQTPVLYKGFEIGRVSHYALEDNGEIRVEIKILKSFRNTMVQNSVIARSTNPITSKTTLEYLRDAGDSRLLPDGAHIPSTDFALGRSRLKALGLASSDPLAGLMDIANQMGGELSGTADQKGSLFRTIDNIAEASDRAQSLLDTVESSLQELNHFAANLNRDNNANAGAVFRTINNLADLSENVNNQIGLLSDLLSSSQRLIDSYSQPDSLIVRMLDPDGQRLFGPVKKILHSLDANLQSSLSLLQSFNASSPEIASLITGLNDSLADARRTLELLNNHPLFKMGAKASDYEPGIGTDRVGELPHAP